MSNVVLTHSPVTRGRHLQALLQGFAAHRVLYFISCLCFAGAYVEIKLLGVQHSFKPISLVTAPVVLIIAALVMIGLIKEIVRLNRAKYQGALLPALWEKIHARDFAPERVSNAVHATICMTVFMMGFTVIKELIPTANPFAWDDAFIELDRVLHFGVQPFEWLAPLLDVPFITYLINLIYNVWFMVMFSFFFWHGFAHRENKNRQQFFVAFMLTWMLGTCIFGTIFSSVGPGLYGRLYPEAVDPFAALIASLNHSNEFYPIYAVSTMDMLWESYVKSNGLVRGISAMPSMHVGSSVIFVLTALASGKRWLIWSSVAFCCSIGIGSVHLGWHYAVDGYAGAAIALICWWAATKIVAWDRAARGVV